MKWTGYSARTSATPATQSSLQRTRAASTSLAMQLAMPTRVLPPPARVSIRAKAAGRTGPDGADGTMIEDILRGSGAKSATVMVCMCQ